MRFLESFKKRGLIVFIYLLIGIILLNAGLIFYFSTVASKADNIFAITSDLKPKIETLRNSAASVDVVARNSVIKTDNTILKQYEALLQTFETNFDTVKYELLKTEVVDEATMNRIDEAMNVVFQSHRKFISTLQGGDSIAIITELNSLYGAFNSVEEFSGDLQRSWNEKFEKVQKSAVKPALLIAICQIALIICLPILIFASLILRNYQKKILALNQEIDDNNRKYVFDSKEDADYTNEDEIKKRLLDNLKKAAHFIQNISSGNYDVRWEGITDANREANRENIAGELIRMREQMKRVKEQDEIRIWTTEGLSEFGEMIRKHQDNFDMLADDLIANVVKYIGAKVGGLFILEENDLGEESLLLRACYAYDRKKYLSKRIEIGQGLVGQVYLEGKTINIVEVPEHYMQITSGLGETIPRSLLVIPLKTNDRIVGVIELASLQEFKKHQVEFLEKLAETVAASIVSVVTAEKTKALLAVSQEQSEEMRAQEEEMRQNMEELEATQEQMARQVAELNRLKASLEEEQYLFNALMNGLPDAIYYKDRDCKLIRVSKYMSDNYGGGDQLIGKSDFDFHDEEHAREAYEDEQNIMRTRKPKVDYIEKESRSDGDHYVSTTKMPLLNLKGEVVGTFGISRDVTKLKKLELDVIEKENILKEEKRIFEERIRKLEDTIKAREAEIEKMKKG